LICFSTSTGFTKVLVGLGVSETGETVSIEVIDLSETHRDLPKQDNACPDLPKSDKTCRDLSNSSKTHSALPKSFKTCQDLPNASKSPYGFGGLGYNNVPVICGLEGGYSSSDRCVWYEDFQWTAKGGSLGYSRSFAAISPSPFPDSKLFITGGIYSSINPIPGSERPFEFFVLYDDWIFIKDPNSL
jgi:hypothetical protein